MHLTTMPQNLLRQNTQQHQPHLHMILLQHRPETAIMMMVLPLDSITHRSPRLLMQRPLRLQTILRMLQQTMPNLSATTHNHTRAVQFLLLHHSCFFGGEQRFFCLYSHLERMWSCQKMYSIIISKVISFLIWYGSCNNQKQCWKTKSSLSCCVGFTFQRGPRCCTLISIFNRKGEVFLRRRTQLYIELFSSPSMPTNESQYQEDDGSKKGDYLPGDIDVLLCTCYSSVNNGAVVSCARSICLSW